jgi:hypothetical protein
VLPRFPTDLQQFLFDFLDAPAALRRQLAEKLARQASIRAAAGHHFIESVTGDTQNCGGRGYGQIQKLTIIALAFLSALPSSIFACT